MGLFGIKIGFSNIDGNTTCDRCHRRVGTVYTPRGVLFGATGWCRQCLQATGRW